MDVRAIPGQEHLPWAEVWPRDAGEDAWREASEAARALGKTGLEVWTTDPEIAESYEARGYEEVRRYLRLELDVAAAPDPGDPGWELTTLAERPELLEQVYALAAETFVDQPGREDAVAPSLEEWRSFAYDPRPKDGFFVALGPDGEPVGFANLELEGDEATHAMTAVARAWRRRGVAGALKRAQIRWAKANGVRVLKTANEVRIAPIRRLNERHGYRETPPEIVLRGPLAAIPLD